MNVVRDAETEQLLSESERIRQNLADAVSELDRYVAALQEYIDQRLPEASAEESKP